MVTRWDVHKYARRAYDLGVRYIGGCCGFEPYHIRAIAEEVCVFSFRDDHNLLTYDMTPGFKPFTTFTIQGLLTNGAIHRTTTTTKHTQKHAKQIQPVSSARKHATGVKSLKSGSMNRSMIYINFVFLVQCSSRPSCSKPD